MVNRQESKNKSGDKDKGRKLKISNKKIRHIFPSDFF